MKFLQVAAAASLMLVLACGDNANPTAGLDAAASDAATSADATIDAAPSIDAGPPDAHPPSALQSFIKPTNTFGGEEFGSAIALSADGSTLVVGAPEESGISSGIATDQTQDANNFSNTGAVYVYVRTGETWTAQQYLKSFTATPLEFFGTSVALSADGNTLAVGASGNNDEENSSGAVYIFARHGATWTEAGKLKAQVAGVDDAFGSSLALSNDGNTLAVGATGESSSSAGINGDQADTAADGSGAVYTFLRNGNGVWMQSTFIKASNPAIGSQFGVAIALSADGTQLAVGSDLENSNATGIDGDPNNEDAAGAGAVYVFTFADMAWSQTAYVKASNTDSGDNFGTTVAMSRDGSTLVVGAPNEQSDAIAIDGDQTDNSAFGAGAAYVFTFDDGAWSQQAYVKASNANAGANFGSGISVSADGAFVAVGASGDSSDATDLNGDQTDHSVSFSGASYTFVRSAVDQSWSQRAYIKAPVAETFRFFGTTSAMSDDGGILAVGSTGDKSAAVGVGGDDSNMTAGSSGAAFVYSLAP